MKDKRIKAALAFSPPSFRKDMPKDVMYGKISIPFLTLTGTDDISPINGTNAIDRRIPFDNMKGPDKYLVIFDGGDHMVFSGQTRRRGDDRYDNFIHKQIRMASTAFLDSYLKNKIKAKEWLSGNGFRNNLATGGTLEFK